MITGKNLNIKKLLHILLGDEKWFEGSLFDICFENPGWYGMVNVVKENPDCLIQKRKITLRKFILFELLSQTDYLNFKKKE